MWKPCDLAHLIRGPYFQAATFEADIRVLASVLNTRLILTAEDTGPIQAFHVAGPDGCGAIFVSHECGDPMFIEVRLRACRGDANGEPIFAASELKEALSAINVLESPCTWISPTVLE